MQKPLLVMVLSLILGSPASLCHAEQPEEIVFTTYYPSPYGNYNELQTNKLAVGDTNGDGKVDASDVPPANGQIYAARSMILRPQGLPATDVREGELVYNNADKALYLYNGASWVKQGVAGGGGCYVSYSGSCLTGFVDKGSAGSYGACLYACWTSRPPGAGCVSGGTSYHIGDARVCCQ
ncbi:MAG: hypothetical protein NT088_02480 [Candidatus Omnitrophica bacterium]|nr:hypothetical protein [Candidatus Omnitrophota bacterium]